MTAVLIGNIYAATIICAWFQWSPHYLVHAMKTLIRSNYHRLVRTSHFNKLFEERDKQWLDQKTKSFTHRLCPNPSILKSIWQCKQPHWMTSDIQEELICIQTQCVQHLKRVQRWICPVSQFIDRVPDARIRHDASTSWGMGERLRRTHLLVAS